MTTRRRVLTRCHHCRRRRRGRLRCAPTSTRCQMMRPSLFQSATSSPSLTRSTNCVGGLKGATWRVGSPRALRFLRVNRMLRARRRTRIRRVCGVGSFLSSHRGGSRPFFSAELRPRRMRERATALSVTTLSAAHTSHRTMQCHSDNFPLISCLTARSGTSMMCHPHGLRIILAANTSTSPRLRASADFRRVPVASRPRGLPG